MRVPRGLRHGHGPQAGGVAGEPAVKRRHAPPPMASDSRTLGRRSAEIRTAWEGVCGCVDMSSHMQKPRHMFNYGSPAIA